MKTMHKKTLSALLAVLLIAAFFTALLAQAREAEPVLKFGDDGKFTIMQVADPQDNENPRKAMLEMLAAAYDKVQPDLVVFTGDNILGRIADSANTYAKKYARVETALDAIIAPLAERDIPFAVTFGNHDDQCGVSKIEQIKIYRRYANCVGFNDTEPSIGRSTFNLPILSSDGSRTAYNIWMMESAGKDESGAYFEYVSTAAIEWYQETSALLRAQNGGQPVISLMFQHIPVPETYELLTEVTKSTPGAVEKDGRYFILNTALAQGSLCEGPCVTQANYGQLDAVAAGGDVSAIVFGHDHVNSFVGTLRGMDIVQTPGASFRSYGNENRGVRVFVIDENDTSSYQTYTLDFFDIMGTSLRTKLMFIFAADEKIPLRIAVCLFPLTMLFI